MKNLWKNCKQLLRPSRETEDSWFYSEPGKFLRFFHIYVKGDAPVILPLIGLMLLTAILSWRFAILEWGIFLSLRGFGEMIYWLLQQFGPKSYRPGTSLKNLSNNSIYILYQLSGLRNAFYGLIIICFTLIYLY
ncbi:MAG: hypothetical protein WCJ58_00450 [bacterium]